METIEHCHVGYVHKFTSFMSPGSDIKQMYVALPKIVGTWLMAVTPWQQFVYY